MLNDIIKIDLHIHSSISNYKENNDDILKCNIENIDILLNKLEENEINLFSITDHNRFDIELYKIIKEKIKSEKYEYVKNILPGIEFDVQLEEGKKACHIVTIFDEDEDKLEKINDILNKNLLKSEKDFYTVKEYEDILYEIGLSTILIAHQKTGLDKSDYDTKSLSESTSCPEEWIRTGYISALEYKQTKVQGMIRKNLRDINRKLATITGSDCHNWEYYPNKDEKNTNEYITKVKCLPTFKGLMFAFTSTESRFDRRSNLNTVKYIDKIIVNNKECKLSKGLNVIIGDNASGKTYLLEKMAGSNNSKYNNLNKLNDIKIERNGEPELTYIRQNQIIENVREGNLFDDKSEYYKEITTNEQFSKLVTQFMEDIKKFIDMNIRKNDEDNKVKALSLPILKQISQKRFYPIMNKDIEIINNINEERLTNISNIYNYLKNEFENNIEYYEGIEIDTKEILKQFTDIIKKIDERTRKININNKVKNIIISAMDNMNIKIYSMKTSAELENDEYIQSIRDFAKSIANSLKIIKSDNKYPDVPKKIEGLTINPLMGYEFIKKARYHDLNIEEDFYNYMFVKDYRSKENIEQINTKKQFADSVLGASSYDGIEEKISNNLGKFINDFKKEERYIQEVSGTTKIGNTPGEIALTFYKILLTQNTNSDVILIDQPEDDISIKRIEEYLQSYLDSMRDKKQVIFVTHNPLLVVNLDVDNVIYINKDEKDKLEVFTGCLEYENEDKKAIIDIVGDNLDGGYETIERRLKIYGKEKKENNKY